MGRGLDGRVRIETHLRACRKSRRDVIALQEVVIVGAFPARVSGALSGRVSSAILQRRRTRKHREGILSKSDLAVAHRPIASNRPERSGRQPRGALRTDIASGTDLFCCLQRAPGTAARERGSGSIDRRTSAQVLDVSGHRIVMGDFNDWNHGLVTSTCPRSFT